MLALGSEKIGNQIHDRGFIVEGDEPVSQTRLVNNCLAPFTVKRHTVPLPVSGRTHTNVYDEIDDGTGHRHHVLGLAWGHVGVVNSAHNTLCRARDVALHGRKAKARDVLQLINSEPFGERAADIPVYVWRNTPRPRNIQWFNVHRTIVAK